MDQVDEVAVNATLEWCLPASIGRVSVEGVGMGRKNSSADLLGQSGRAERLPCHTRQ